ncbi:MAG: DUF2637 domain-containing protein [Mycolicibacterium cosmeticum]|nr:DUF2637 domain-containing protein [Mycolicibacterium cosmeticum]
MSEVSVASRRSLATTRTAAAVITVGIGIASFVLSFTALADLAVRAGISERLAWLWPLIVDGTILQATMAIVALAGVEGQQRNRRYFWIVLAISAAVSVVGNGWHAVLPGSAPLSPWLAAAIAVVAPVSLLAATHGLSLLIRVSVPRAPLLDAPTARPDVSPVVVEPVEVESAPVIVDEAHQPWIDVADVIVARGGHADVDTVAAALHLSFERNLSPKSIGRQLGVEQDLILDIITVGDELIGSGDVRVERVGV